MVPFTSPKEVQPDMLQDHQLNEPCECRYQSSHFLYAGVFSFVFVYWVSSPPNISIPFVSSIMRATRDLCDPWVCACGVCQTLRDLSGCEYRPASKWGVTREDMVGEVRRLHGLQGQISAEQQYSSYLSAENEQLRSEIEEKDATIGAERRETERMGRLAREILTESRMKDDTIKMRDDKIRWQDKRFNWHFSIMQEQSTSLEMMNTTILEQAADIKTKDDQRQELAANIAVQDSKISVQSQQIENAAGRIKQLESTVAHLQAYVDEISEVTERLHHKRQKRFEA
jgi:hypothetical protein